MPIQAIKDRLFDILGIMAIGHVTIANLMEIILGVNWSIISLVITTILSIIYLFFRIREARKTSDLRVLEIEKKQLELEKIKAEILKINSKIDVSKLVSNFKKQ